MNLPVKDTIPETTVQQDTLQNVVLQVNKPVYKPKIFKPSEFIPDAISQSCIDSSIYDAYLGQYLYKNQPNNVTDYNIYQQYTRQKIKNDTILVEKQVQTIKKVNRDDYLIQPHNFEGTDFITGFLMLLIFNIAWLYVFFGRTVGLFLKAAFDPKYTTRLIANKNPVTIRAGFMLNLNFILSFALFIYYIIVYYSVVDFKLNTYFHILLISSILSVIYVLRYIILHISEWIVRNEYFSEYLIIILALNKVYGIIILPVTILITYANYDYIRPLISFGIIIFIIIYLTRIIRGFFISLKIRLSLFYFILYICTLEIIPVMLLYKIVNLIVNN